MPSKLPATRKAQTLAPAQGALPDLGAVEADHFEGWPLEDIRGEVLRFAPGLSRAEKITEQYRRLVGLGLYVVLAEEGERAGTDFIREVVESSGVAARTVGNWRRAAMDAFSLPPPTARSVAAVKRVTPRESRRVAPALDVPSAEKTPLPPLSDSAYPAGAERLPVDAVDPAKIVEHARGEWLTESDHPPPVLRAPPPPNPCPTCKGTGIAPGRTQAPTRRPMTKAERGPRFARSNCPHTPGARVGDMCMDCETRMVR